MPHYLLNKPHSYLSQFTNQHTTRRNKRMLGELYDFAPGTMSVGRLDEPSEGLLLLTTDGRVSAAVNQGGVENRQTDTQRNGSHNHDGEDIEQIVRPSGFAVIVVTHTLSQFSS